MPFGYFKHESGRPPGFEYLPGKDGETFAVGELLVQSADGLTKCGATAAPGFLCVGKQQSDGCVPVTRVRKDIVYTATLTAAGTALKVGNKVTISADGLGVTATTTSGVAEIVSLPGTADGDEILVRF